jgi:hypothetical protein
MKRLFALTAVVAIAASACADTPQNGTPGNAFNSSAAKPASGPAATPVSTTGNSPSSAPAVTSSAPAAPTPAAPAYREVTLPAGTVLPVDLETSLGSDISRVEQRVNGRLRRAVTSGGVEVLPAGTAVIGHVTAAERPGRVKGRGSIAFRFTEIDTPGAGTTRMSTGTISRIAPATKKKDAAKIGVPAGVGAVIGGIVGGGDGAAKGAVIGGAAGTGYVLSTRGKDVRLGPGADLAVRLTAPLTVRVPIR